MRFGPEQLLDGRPHQWNPRGSTHHNDFVDLLYRHASVLDAIAAGTKCAIHYGRDQLVEQLPIDLALIFPAVVLEFHSGEWDERKLLLGVNNRATKALHSLAV